MSESRLVTSLTLLVRLREGREPEAWERFARLYAPVLFAWARRLGLQTADASDLVQDVLTSVFRGIAEFNHQGHRSFRGWLRTILMNKWRDRVRRLTVIPTGDLDSAVAGLETDVVSDAEYRQWLVARALQLMQTEFEPSTWQACWDFVAEGLPAVDVARKLGLTENAVYLAKGRVLRRLRQELDGLMD